MQNITDAASFARALDSPIGKPIKALLRKRRDQLLKDAVDLTIGDVGHLIVVGSGDTVPAIEAAAGYPVVTDPAFEWVADHGGLFEAVTILSDDGFAVVIIVPDLPAVDATVLALLREHASPAHHEADDPADGERRTAA